MKAKDLRGKNVEDIEQDSDNPEKEDQVTAAYENISKKLDSIRNGINVDESDESEGSRAQDDSDEPELEEWKGPKPPKLESEEPEEDEHELRKVNLRNLEDEKEEPEAADESKGSKAAEDEEIDDLEGPEEAAEEEEAEDEKEPEENDMKDKKDWKPVVDDPLDDEDAKEEPPSSAEASADNEEEEESDDMEADLEKAKGEEVTANEKPGDKESGGQDEIESGPDTLDDLADENPLARGSGNEPVEESFKDEPALNEPEEEDYSIPNLKGSRQTGGSIGYNAHPQRESFGQSYSPKGNNMEGNDPNNFFSQHQPQPAKRANKFHLLVLVIIGIIVIGFTVYILKGGFGDINLGTTQPSPSPSATATPEPTPTPTPEPDRAQYKLKVLNGSGKTGLAASVSSKLKELGYQTEKTGNATNSAFTQTIVRVKPSLESFIPQIIQDLTPDFDAAGNASLKDSDTVDIEVILGAK